MRNLKKIIAVVVTLVMLFALASVSASAATAPIFSLRGATEVSLTEAAADGESAQYYELAVHLEDADKTVGAIEGVITYDPAVFTYKETALGAALKADAANTVENTVDATEAGKVKFVGLSTEAGVWFVLRFSIVAEGPADFALEAKAANRTGTAYLNVTVNGASTTIVDENMISMEGGAILKNTVGLPNPKNVLTGENYNTGDKKGLNAVFVEPSAAIDKPTWTKGLMAGYDLTAADNGEAKIDIYTQANVKGQSDIYNGLTSLFFYVEVPDDVETAIRMYNNFNQPPSNSGKKYLTATHYTTFHFLDNDSDAWVSKSAVPGDKWNEGSNTGYYCPLPAGFKGLVRVDYLNFIGAEWYNRVSAYSMGFTFIKLAEGTTIKFSKPWLAEEYTSEYEPRSFNEYDKSEYSEPTQDLTFNVTIDSALVAEAEAKYGEVVEAGTLFMYTQRLAYRELSLDMDDTTGLVKASKTFGADDEIVGFTANLRNIKWSAMGVSVSARSYIKFADGTVIYSKNYNNEFETNAGYARESVIGVAVDIVKAGDFNAAKAAELGYNVDAIKTIANKTSITGQDRKDLLNFIADCYAQH